MAQVVLKPYGTSRMGVKEWQVAESTSLALITDGVYTAAMFNTSLEELNVESKAYMIHGTQLMRKQVHYPMCAATVLCFAGIALGSSLSLTSASDEESGYSPMDGMAPMVAPILGMVLWTVAICFFMRHARKLTRQLKERFDSFLARINARDSSYGVQWQYREIYHQGAGDDNGYTEYEIVVKRDVVVPFALAVKVVS
ncbi:hypothetical protein SDRG_16411 [Saprolegnia diclina VS20]|uniref:Uncharacterized protein n=1 Tax=Saprolegnia diclina (strain VS20) TaxID=1156394 RepID=T0PXJ4_SAPDV|nr:hypothetical protein SDRG_16411 [Saprolegnia diclina VS20]EQC25750.1 hypothetical protein SDRG_16411 [Saprolegnia diclina VS20]|eukprot:XP_008620842.1 hypothetical protein SDRG_16411 [Saprolegnia diclina VS20]